MSLAACMSSNKSHHMQSSAQNQELKVSNLDSSAVQREQSQNSGSFFCGPRLSARKKSAEGIIYPKVFLLDSSEKQFKTSINQPARHLLEKCCQYLKINEMDIFGIYFRDLKNRKIWLNMTQPLSKQIRNIDSQNWIFVFRVKFYPSDIGHIAEDITRYYLALQVRNDLITQRLQASFNVCVTIAAYIVQSEIGDHSDEKHGEGIKYIKDFNFIPNQSHEFLEKVSIAHKTLRGFEPTETDAKLLSFVMKLALYGQHMQPVVDKTDNSELNLAVNYSGLTVYSGKLIRHFFPWQMITKMHSNSKLFHIEVRADLNSNKKKCHVYRMSDEKANDAFMNLVIEHHIFFRLKEPEDMVYEKSMTFGGKQGYSYDGSTIFKKCSEKNSSNNNANTGSNQNQSQSLARSITFLKDNKEASLSIPVQPASIVAADQSTPMKDPSNSSSRVLPISVLGDGTESFDLKRFDYENSPSRSYKTSSNNMNSEIIIQPEDSKTAEDETELRYSENSQLRSKTLTIHVDEVKDDDREPISMPINSSQADNMKPTAKTIHISVEKSEGTDSDFSNVIDENIQGFVQMRIDNIEAANDH